MNTATAELSLDLVDTDLPNYTAPALQQPREVTIPDSSPMSMMMAAMRQGATLADVREMMAIHREMKADEARETFRADFAAFRGENIIIPKTKEVDRGRGGSFNQAEYDVVCRRLSPALSRHGFSFRHDQKFGLKRVMHEGTETDVGWVWVTCYLEHRKGHSERLELEGPPGDLTVNSPTQNMQSTASYLKRQSLLAITGTATGGEDDEAKMHGGQAEDDWAAKASKAETARDLQEIRRKGTDALTKARDRAGYAAFAAAVKARAAELEAEHA